MSRPKKSRQLSPLVIPLVAGGLTLLLAGLVLFFSINMVREVPVPGPTITVSAPPTITPSAPQTDPVVPSQSNQDGTVSQQAPPAVPQGPQEPPPVNPQPVAPQPQPAPQEQQPVAPPPPVEPPGIVEEAAKVGEAILCSIFCPL